MERGREGERESWSAARNARLYRCQPVCVYGIRQQDLQMCTVYCASTQRWITGTCLHANMDIPTHKLLRTLMRAQTHTQTAPATWRAAP